MHSRTTNDVKISVSCHYDPERSYPLRNHYVFEYQVTIENLGFQTIQLLTRHWFIFDSSGFYKEVDGEGVIGKQPILAPNESHSYHSWCTLKTPVGSMEGTYNFNVIDGFDSFDAHIPKFELIAPYKLN